MKTDHTPGPLKVVEVYVNNGPNEIHITTGRWGEPSVAVVRSKADADLFASAPEMLEALLAINAALTQPVQFSGTDTPGTCNILRGDCQVAGSIARVAIAKAQGKC